MNTQTERKNKKGGRPRLAPEERRTEKLSAAVNPIIHERFRKHSEAAGLTTSDFLHTVILEWLQRKEEKRK